jgi:hypothetical protein
MTRSSRNQLEPRRGGGISEGVGSTQVTFDVLSLNLVWFLVPGVGIGVTTQGTRAGR